MFKNYFPFSVVVSKLAKSFGFTVKVVSYGKTAKKYWLNAIKAQVTIAIIIDISSLKC